MNSLKNIFAIAIVVIIFNSCKTDIESPVPSSGDADFSRYVALGSSFTAGYTDGALYLEGQQNSFPAMLAQVFSEAGSGAFKQPLVNAGVGIGINGNAKLILNYGTLCNGTSGFITAYAAPMGDQSILTNLIGVQGPFNNLGVPGIKSGDFNDQFFVNPFYARFASNPGGSSVLSEAIAMNPTFFTLLIGIEDIYQYALQGGDKNVSDSITSVADFNANVDIIISSLVSAGAMGAIANIPEVGDFPYFTTIPYDGLVLTAAEAQDLNAFFVADPDISFHEGNNPYLVQDTSTISDVRQMKPGEFVLLNVSQDSICKGYGSFDPLQQRAWGFEDKHVLDTVELSYLRARIFSFRDKLQAVAVEKNLAYVDLYDLFRKINNGIIFNGVSFSSDFITGKTFSLDGFHPTPQGYALIANEFIKAINSKYGATLHEVDANSYPGIRLP